MRRAGGGGALGATALSKSSGAQGFSSARASRNGTPTRSPGIHGLRLPSQVRGPCTAPQRYSNDAHGWVARALPWGKARVPSSRSTPHLQSVGRVEVACNLGGDPLLHLRRGEGTGCVGVEHRRLGRATAGWPMTHSKGVDGSRWPETSGPGALATPGPASQANRVCGVSHEPHTAAQLGFTARPACPIHTRARPPTFHSPAPRPRRHRTHRGWNRTARSQT